MRKKSATGRKMTFNHKKHVTVTKKAKTVMIWTERKPKRKKKIKVHLLCNE